MQGIAIFIKMTKYRFIHNFLSRFKFHQQAVHSLVKALQIMDQCTITNDFSVLY